MLSENFQEGFLDLSCVDWYTLFFHLLHLFPVEFHKFDIWVSLNRLHLVIDDLVVTVDTVDVLK